MSGDARTTDYLSVTLELTESVVPEMRKLVLTPEFSTSAMEFSFEGKADDEEEVVTLNRAQIECLVDFLGAWLGRHE